MHRDPTLFRNRFKMWKEGKDVYEAGLPKFYEGDDAIQWKDLEHTRFTSPETRRFENMFVTPSGVKYKDAYQMRPEWNDGEFVSTLLMPTSLLSPTHVGRALYNLFTGTGYDSFAKNMFMPNSGIVSNQFASEHPWLALGANIATDVVTGEALNRAIGPTLRFIDRKGTPQSSILNLSDDTMTRLIGTEDSGYKDLLTSGIIRGNKKITSAGTTKDLHRIADKIENMVSEDDLRAYLSNNFINEQQYNRIRDAVKSLEKPANPNTTTIRLLLKRFWDLPDTYAGYIKMTTDPAALQKQNVAMASRLFSGMRKNKWVKNWLPSENVTVQSYDWPNLPTFALKNEKLNNTRFVGDFAVQIKNASKHAQEATDFGHFAEHPTTKYPMAYTHPDVTVYRRSDGLLTGKKYMKKIPSWKLKYDAWRYANSPEYRVLVSKNYNPMFPEGDFDFTTPYGLNFDAFYKQQSDNYKNGKDAIYIKPSKRGTFTAAAKEHGKSVQQFASQVLANKSNYSPAMVKKANFAKNASKWNR